MLVSFTNEIDEPRAPDLSQTAAEDDTVQRENRDRVGGRLSDHARRVRYRVVD